MDPCKSDMAVPAAGRRVVVRPDNRVETESFTPRTPKPGEVLIETLYTLRDCVKRGKEG